MDKRISCKFETTVKTICITYYFVKLNTFVQLKTSKIQLYAFNLQFVYFMQNI